MGTVIQKTERNFTIGERIIGIERYECQFAEFGRHNPTS